MAKENLKMAKLDWEIFKDEAKTARQRYLLDLNGKTYDEIEEIPEKEKLKITKKIARTENRNMGFKYLTQNVGKGPNKSIGRLHVKDEDGKNEKIVTN